jgi:hypothetical protein
MGRCNCHGFSELYNSCAFRYTLREILFIKPKLIIIQGRAATECIMTLLNISNNNFKYNFHKVKLEKTYPYYEENICAGEIINEKENFQSKFISVPHTAINYKNNQYKNKEFWLELRNYLKDSEFFKN